MAVYMDLSLKDIKVTVSKMDPHTELFRAVNMVMVK